MYRNLFAAWYCLGVLALCFATFGILTPFIGADRAVGGFGFLGLFGFLPLFPYIVFPKEKYDERDIAFLQRALFSGFCLGFSAICGVTGVLAFSCQFLRGDSSIPVQFMWFAPYFGMVVGIFSFSFMILQLYYKGENPDTWRADR
jgi:hypothetical protein